MNKKNRIVAFTLLTLVSIVSIVYVFWHNEVKFLLPTPIPKTYSDIKIGEQIPIFNYIQKSNKPALLHFFNPECPCSRFNIKELKQIIKEHKDSIEVYLVLEDIDSSYNFTEKYDLNLPVLKDSDGKIADLCGVYSTPQAVVVKPNGTIYYKGNYNIARYCNASKTRFANIALTNLLAGKPLPPFSKKATEAYGCNLPSDELSLIEESLNK